MIYEVLYLYILYHYSIIVCFVIYYYLLYRDFVLLLRIEIIKYLLY